MKRKHLPDCPFCGSRMLPQALTLGWISYVCSNTECKAVGPRERTFAGAAEKARNRVGVPMEWFSREEYIPMREDDYLCEYGFVSNWNDEPTALYYGVQRWNEYGMRFSRESNRRDFNGFQLRVYRWMDFKSGARVRATVVAATQEKEDDAV